MEAEAKLAQVQRESAPIEEEANKCRSVMVSFISQFEPGAEDKKLDELAALTIATLKKEALKFAKQQEDKLKDQHNQ